MALWLDDFLAVQHVPRAARAWPADDWRVWIVAAGRGWGKTHLAARMSAQAVERGYRRLGLMGADAPSVRSLMVDNPGIGLLSHVHDAVYVAARGELRWPNGAFARLYDAATLPALSGVCIDWLWGDDVDHWSPLALRTALDMLRPTPTRVSFDPGDGPPQTHHPPHARALLTLDPAGTGPQLRPLLEDLLRAPGTVLTWREGRDPHLVHPASG